MFADPGLELFYLLRLGALAGLLSFSVVRARGRWARGEPEDQGRRILIPWITVIFGFCVYLGGFTILFHPLIILYVVAVVAVWVAVPSVASIVVVDLGAKLLKAERSGFWLGAAIIAFVAIAFAWLGLLGLGPLLLVPGLWVEFIALASIPASAAILWWSWLPEASGGENIAETFE